MAGLYIMIGLLMCLCPISAAVYCIGRAADRLLLHRRLSVVILGIGGLALLYVGTIIHRPIIPLEAAKGVLAHVVDGLWQIDYTPVSVWQWMISDPRTIGLSLALEALAGYLTQYTPERLMIAAEQHRERKKYKLTKHIDYVPRRMPEHGKGRRIGKTTLE